jgi:protein-ribulosamine 3-kinase
MARPNPQANYTTDPIDTAIAMAISRATGEPFSPDQHSPEGGGCINQTYSLADGRRRYFVKRNRAEALTMFTAESEGLHEIRASHSLKAPEPICFGLAGSSAYLVLEYLALRGQGNWTQMARQLALMHRSTAEKYGWRRDNTIGATHQPNAWTATWVAFLCEQRLGYQLELAKRNGYGGTLQANGEALLARVQEFFIGYVPHPSLLHGDLWPGNAAFTANGEPVIFDPAIYYGDREADLAMTELFGGFPAEFYFAYHEAWPLDQGYRVRKSLYNLYHILNHANLFGGGYAAQAQTMLEKLLAELG